MGCLFYVQVGGAVEREHGARDDVQDGGAMDQRPAVSRHVVHRLLHRSRHIPAPRRRADRVRRCRARLRLPGLNHAADVAPSRRLLYLSTPYPRPTLRTKKYCSFINYGLSHYQ